jgi:hypothetical protein
MYRYQIFSLVFVLFFTINIQSAYAYIDPASGSIVLQALVGVLVGLGITIKIYWYKIKERLMQKNNNTES